MKEESSLRQNASVDIKHRTGEKTDKQSFKHGLDMKDENVPSYPPDMFIAGHHQVGSYNGKGTSTDIFDLVEFNKRYGRDASRMLREIDEYGAAFVPIDKRKKLH